MILAHGVGSRSDLPLPAWLFAYSASFALLISFVALGILWPSPRLAAAARGRALPSAVEAVGRAATTGVQAATMLLFAVTLWAALAGPDDVSRNLAPTALFVAFWVGLQLVSAVFGDVWRWVNPLWLVAAGLDRIRGRDPAASRATGWWASYWPAAAGLLAYQWLELAYHRPGAKTAVLAFLLGYCGAVLTGGVVFGAAWVRNGDGFAVLFGLLAALSPVHRDDTGRWSLRVPGSGLASIEPGVGTIGVVLVVLGGTTFDGVSRTQFWTDLVGTRRNWDRTLVMTGGLLVTIAAVTVAYLVATGLVGRIAGDGEDQTDRWLPSLVPIVLAYSVAHYFSLLVFEGQNFVALLSDPLGQGWDLLGTAANRIDYTAVSPNQIAYVQVGSIVVGHVLGVVVAHDTAVDRYRPPVAARSQYPLLGVMIVYTTVGLLLLLNA